MNLSDLLNTRTEVVVGGETVTLRKATIAEEAAFSKWLKSEAKREAAIVPDGTPPDVADAIADRQTNAVFRQIGARLYEPLSELYVEAQQRPDGMAEFLYLVLKTDHPGMTRAKVKKLIEDGLAEAFLRVLQAEEADPKIVRELAAALGFPPNFLDSSETSSSPSPTPLLTATPGPSSS